MTDRKAPQYGTPDIVDPALVSFPCAAESTFAAGDMGATNAAGNAVPVSADPTLKIWGNIEQAVVNTAAALVGNIGDLSVTYRQGVFGYVNGSGSEACTKADAGNIVYASGPRTISRHNGGGLYPAAGRFFGLGLDGLCYVGLGMASLYDTNDDLPGGADVAVINIRARNIVNGNIADLTAYTVASNAAVNDATLNVEGDIVLLIGQTTAAQNGLYKVGAVATGTAPLTRIYPMAAGQTFTADQIEVSAAVGTIFGHTKWFNTVTGVSNTNDPGFYPESVTVSQVLTAGTAAAITSIPLLSATKSNVLYTRTATGGTLTNTVGYQTVPAPTPGKAGTASIVPMAVVAAGTIQNLDTSTLLVTVINR